jgi:hypothetical protein
MYIFLLLIIIIAFVRCDRQKFESLPLMLGTYDNPRVYNGLFKRLPFPEITHGALVSNLNSKTDQLSMIAFGL